MLVRKKVAEVGGKSIPLDIHVERRNGWRVAVGKNAVILRLPDYASEEERRKQEKIALEWLEKMAKQKPQSLAHLVSGELENVTRKFTILGTEYRLHLHFEDRNSLKGTRKAEDIELFLPEILRKPNVDQINTVNQLISRIVCKKYSDRIAERTMTLNRLYFGKEIREIKLKYLHSRWGSCSSQKNINLSSRLLLAPEPVMDYVIIHELAHLVEMNHSAAFWRLVEQADKSYETKETWLKKNGHLCHFISLQGK